MNITVSYSFIILLDAVAAIFTRFSLPENCRRRNLIKRLLPSFLSFLTLLKINLDGSVDGVGTSSKKELFVFQLCRCLVFGYEAHLNDI